MAKSARKGSLAKRAAVWLLIIGLVAAVFALWSNRVLIGGVADVGTSYSARVACSCRFVADRSLADCEKDQLGGMELVSLSDDKDARSVTASFPLLASSTATYREGYGCVLEEWAG